MKTLGLNNHRDTETQSKNFFVSACLFISAVLLLVTALPGFCDSPESDKAPNSTKSIPTPSYDVRVELTQIAIRVVDKNGNWVSGIQPADLILSEDGQPQEILFVDEVAPQDDLQQVSPASPNNPSPQRPVHVILVLDGINSSKTSIEKHKLYIRDFL